MRYPLFSHCVLPLRVFLILLGVAIVLGCAPSYEQGPVPPLPDGCPSDNPPSNNSELAACLTALEFDTLEAAGDEQRLTIFETAAGVPGGPCPPGVPDSVRSCRHGPLAVIQPEINSHLHGQNELKAGRIIAKLRIPASEKDSYEKLAMVPGHTTYWWVQRDPRRPDSSAGRSVYITEVKGQQPLPMKEYPLVYVRHEGKFKQALARWVWDPTDEKTQGSCSQGCCR